MLWSIDMLSSTSPQHLREQNTRSLLASDTSDSSRSCSICEPDSGVRLVAGKRVSYAGNSTTCGDLSASIYLSTKESSFTCSIARTSLASLCCSEPCHMCPDGVELNAKAMIKLGDTQVSCAEYRLTLEMSGINKGSAECDSSASDVFESCCEATFENDDVSSLESASPARPCNICQRDNVHHELKSEAKVEYKGTLLSCLDMNSHLAKTESEGSDICLATHSMLFDGCCYEKCSLCGGKSLRWDAQVNYNNQILSCDELPPMLTLVTVREGSDQCDAMQAAYSSTCCFDPPKKKCTLCSEGEVNKHSFIKTQSSSLHCVNLVNDLAEREEDGSQVCKESKQAYALACCNSPLLPNDKGSNFGQLVDYTPSSSSHFFKIPFWSFVLSQFLCL